MAFEEIERATVINVERIRRGVAEILAALPLDTSAEGLRDTPDRVADMYADLFSGLAQDPREVLRTGFEEGYDEMVIVRDIQFASMCEHHLLPFFGLIHIGYVPTGRVVGISKLARVAEILSRRPQVQERLSAQIAETLVDALEPLGAAVEIEAEHTCMTVRGVRKPGSRIITSVSRGVFRDDPRTRAEFLTLMGHPAR